MGLTNASEIIQATGIGATDIAPIIGISPFADRWQVYARKKGMIDPEDTVYKTWGRRLEPVIAEVFSEEMDLPVERSTGRIYSAERPWQYASPDYFILTEPERELLECKTAGLHQSGDWDRDVGNEDGVPDYYLAQVEWQLSVTKLKVAYIGVLIAGNDFRIYQIHHDPVLEEILLEEGEKFWREHLMADVEPPIGGSETAARYLKKRFPRERERSRPAKLNEIPLLDEYAALKAHLDELQAQRDELENQLRLAIGDATGLKWSRGELTWKKTKDRQTVQWENFAIGLQNEFMKDEAEREKWRAFYTVTEEGHRRFHLRQRAA